jgi:hypothetical protein
MTGNQQNKDDYRSTDLVCDLIQTCWGCPACNGMGHLYYPAGCFVCRACEPYRSLVRNHLPAVMNMDTAPGSKVRFSHGFNGWDHDVKQARVKLTLGAIYTVKRVEMDDSSTTVWLEEFPGERWNHVLFSNAEAV